MAAFTGHEETSPRHISLAVSKQAIIDNQQMTVVVVLGTL